MTSLPPGVTDKDIDDQIESADCDCCGMPIDQDNANRRTTQHRTILVCDSCAAEIDKYADLKRSLDDDQ